jgi:hypothetical protein
MKNETRQNVWKGMLTGAAGGLVAWWALDRFYTLARATSSKRALIPYCAGAALGGIYGLFVLRHHPDGIARVPLGAAVYLADPERTAAPPKGGRDASEKTGNLTLRLASRGLKKIAQAALFT